MKSKFMVLLAVIISDVMCLMLGYMYSELTSKITSFPIDETLIVYSIPFLLGIFVCLLCAFKWRERKPAKKSKKNK